MAVTKGEIVTRALRKIAVASNATLTNIEPESKADALQDLDDMMAEWDGTGIRVGYKLTNPQSPDDDSGIPDFAVRAVSLKLAIFISPDYLRPAMDEVAREAEAAMDNLLTAIIHVPQTPRRGDMPRGQGNKDIFPRGRFYQQQKLITVENDGTLDNIST